MRGWATRLVNKNYRKHLTQTPLRGSGIYQPKTNMIQIRLIGGALDGGIQNLPDQFTTLPPQHIVQNNGYFEDYLRIGASNRFQHQSSTAGKNALDVLTQPIHPNHKEGAK